MSVKRALVTGATGMLGLNLVQLLSELGWEVLALHRATSDVATLDRFPVTKVVGDVTDLDSLLAALPEGVDAVFHTAASTSLWSRRRAAQERTNVDGTRNVVEACLRRAACRLVHTSSVVVWGFHDQPVSEDTPAFGERSSIGYFRTKALAEGEVRSGIARGLDAVILNPANIIGRHDVSNWSRALRMVHDGSLPGVPPGRASFCHARQVAEAHVAAVAQGQSGGRYLLGGADASYLELIQVIGAVAGKRVPDRPTPILVLRALGRVNHWLSYVTNREPDLTPEGVALVTSNLCCRSDRAQRELGYRPSNLEEMVRDCWDWMRAERLLGP